VSKITGASTASHPIKANLPQLEHQF